MEIPTTEPASLQAGDTIRWRVSLSCYPAGEGWELQYRLVNAQNNILITSSASGDDHLVEIPASTSAAYAPGTYTATRYVTKGAERFTIGKTEIVIKPDLAGAAAPVDGRSEAQRALDDLKSALLKWLSTSGQIQEYEIAGRKMKFATADEIRARIGLAQRAVADEKAAARLAAGLSTGRRILTRF